MTINVRKIGLTVSRIFTAPMRRQNRSKIRQMMRGYRYLKQEGRLHIIEDAVQHLREFQLSIPSKSLPISLWGAALPSAELIIRQQLSSYYLAINSALLIASATPGGKAIAAFPRVWRDQLEQLGFPVDHLKSALAWKFRLLRHVSVGISRILLTLIKHKSKNTSNLANRESYIYFCDLTHNNLPFDDEDTQSFCIINWYCKWQNKLQNIHSLRHSVPTSALAKAGNYQLRFQLHPIPELYLFRQKVRLMSWFLISLVRVAISAISGYWWNLMIFREALASYLVRQSSPTQLAKEYWFHNSRYYPPLWTYELPEKKSQAIFYFYSSNFEPFPRPNLRRPFVTPYSIMNWPKYLIWYDYQYDFLQKCDAKSCQVQFVGPIHFSDSYQGSVRSSEFIVSCFPVTPFRHSKYTNLCLCNDIYSPASCISFIDDVVEAASCHGLKVIIKLKRDIGSLSHPLFRAAIARLECDSRVLLCDPSVSAFKLIKNSDIAISMPFTSTASIAREFGKDSIYYHPNSSLKSLPSGLYGDLPLISIKSDLSLYLSRKSSRG
jgi:polysaccharide biosynthesis PFTS motif protein